MRITVALALFAGLCTLLIAAPREVSASPAALAVHAGSQAARGQPIEVRARKGRKAYARGRRRSARAYTWGKRRYYRPYYYYYWQHYYPHGGPLF
jgi:hypothetical protein